MENPPSAHTPSTGYVRLIYVGAIGDRGDGEAFDRWLDTVRAAAFEEGLEAGANAEANGDWSNPYRDGSK